MATRNIYFIIKTVSGFDHILREMTFTWNSVWKNPDVIEYTFGYYLYAIPLAS